MSPYTYVLNAPLSLIDPDGLEDRPREDAARKKRIEARTRVPALGNEPVTADMVVCPQGYDCNVQILVPVDVAVLNPAKGAPNDGKPMTVNVSANVLVTGTLAANGTFSAQHAEIRPVPPPASAGTLPNARSGNIPVTFGQATVNNGSVQIPIQHNSITHLLGAEVSVGAGSDGATLGLTFTSQQSMVADGGGTTSFDLSVQPTHVPAVMYNTARFGPIRAAALEARAVASRLQTPTVTPILVPEVTEIR
jgi:hypothetical protein